MSRIAKAPLILPKGVEIKLDGSKLVVKGGKNELSINLHETIDLKQEQDHWLVIPKSDQAIAMAGTFRSLIGNMVTGVSEGFEKKLELRGVGYRAQMQGKKLNLTLGFSHPIDYDVPEGITIETPSQTEITVKGADKQQVGQVAAVIRGYRPPEPYKGKGVRYVGERIVMKEAKKA